jgi:6-phospho-beta-glucosidase
MKPPRVAILGGGGPFTVGLINALSTTVFPARTELVLHGRTASTLEMVVGYGRRRLGPHGWTVLGTTELSEAVEGASVVLHQIRYGGLEGRRDGEEFCARFGQVADETLGPAALRTALLLLPQLERTIDELLRRCPDAWVINLVNPLSSVTAIMGDRLKRCVGVCELPRSTAARIAAVFGLDLDELEWRYSGLNHRGFIHYVRHGGRDLLSELPSRLRDRTIAGVRASEIARLGAVPLKYHRIVSGGARPMRGRSEFLLRLREQLLTELRADPHRSPPSLRRRDQSWYPEAVIPAVRALLQGGSTELVINLRTEHGIVEEVHATLGDEVRLPTGPTPPSPVVWWLDRFRCHEQAVLAALRAPAQERISEALRLDPTVGGIRAGEISTALWRDVQPTIH